MLSHNIASEGLQNAPPETECDTRGRGRGRGSRHFVAATILAALIAFAAGSLVGFGFTTHDDPQEVYNNPDLFPISVSSLARIWTQPDYGHVYIPLHYSALAVVATVSRLIGGTGDLGTPDPRFFHLVQLCLHAWNSILVLGLIRRLLKVGALPALVGALIFALHPLQVEGYARASGTTVTLGTLFGLLALSRFLTVATGRSKRSEFSRPYVQGTLLFVAALLTRSAFVTLPLVAGLLAWGVSEVPARKAARLATPWLLLAALYGIWTLSLQPDAALYPGVDVPLWQRPLLALNSLAFYLAKTVLPAGLAIDHGQTPSVLLTGASTLTGIFVAIGILILFSVLPGNRRFYFVCVVAFALGVLPNTGLLPAPSREHFSVVADRYAYFALFAVAMLVAAGCAGRYRRWFFAATALAIPALAWGTHRQVGHWRDSLHLFSHTIRVTPDSWYAYSRLGTEFLDRGALSQATSCFERALELRPTHPEALVNLSRVALKNGENARAKELSQRALDVNPYLPSAHNNLGVALLREKDFTKADTHFARALELAPGFSDAHKNFGISKRVQGKIPDAIRSFETALALTQGDDPSVLDGLALCFLASGETTDANTALTLARSACELRPGQPVFRNTLARAQKESGDLATAIATCEETISLPVLTKKGAPFPEATYELLSGLYAKNGKIEEAAHIEKLLAKHRGEFAKENSDDQRRNRSQ